MLNYVKIISSELNDLSGRILKHLGLGLNDTQTSEEVAPFGLDSNPPKDMIAIYGKTQIHGETVIIGYLNKNQLADIGEFRTFSVDEDGNQAFYTWLKNDGTMEIGGDSKNLARFQELKQGFDALKDDFNDHVQKWNTFANAYAPGGPSSLGTPPIAQASDPSTASIDSAKIDEIKTL
jgi:hypothetical protein